MGKVNKRRNRDKRREKTSESHRQQGAVNSSGAIHQLRHPDPKIRHGALVALQTSFLHSHKQVSLKVLQAVREQVVDSNLECASAAAECLSQYLYGVEEDPYSSTTAGWLLVLLERLKECHQGTTASSQTIKQSHSLAAPSLRALCRLIETNEKALTPLNSKKEEFLSTMFGLLHNAMEFNPSSASKDSRAVDWVAETSTYAARALHSSLDENPEMVEVLNRQYCDADRWGSAIQSLPVLAKFHLCGCLVNCYQVAPVPWLSTSILRHAIPCILTSLDVDASQLQSMEEKYHQALNLYNEQKADSELENEIVQTIQQRKEPARLIARRLKQTPRGSDYSGKIDPDQKDGQQAMQETLITWTDFWMPYQVALEITANLLSCLIVETDQMDTGVDDDQLNNSILEALVTAQLTKQLVNLLQAMCSYRSMRDEKHKILASDLDDGVSKASACLANCVLAKVIPETEFGATWQAVRPHATAPGVCGVLVVLTQCSSMPPSDLGLVFQLLHCNTDETVLRDAVCLLTATLAGHPQPADVVTTSTKEFSRILLDKRSPYGVKLEILHSLMDLYGQDDFHPHVFEQLDVLTAIRRCIATMPKKNLEPEEKDILFNAERFVDYKLGR